MSIELQGWKTPKRMQGTMEEKREKAATKYRRDKGGKAQGAVGIHYRHKE